MPDNDARKLLDFLIHGRLATLEEKQAEFATRAIDPGDQPATMAAHEVQTEADAADRLFPAFRDALRHAGHARAASTSLILDDADPQQNAMADALIRFLVKAHLASVETTELAPDHFRYAVTIDWPGMIRTATMAGADLDAALRS